MSDYAQRSDEDLISALEIAGRTPRPALIETILARQESMGAILADRFADWIDDHWDDPNDPRWYRFVHAGRILLAWKEVTALPTFAEIYRNSDDCIEWYEDAPARFGPPAIPYFRDVLLSETGTDWHYGKALASDVLANIALLYPETREQVRATLVDALPQLRDVGRVSHPDDRAPDETWGAIVGALAALRDTASRDLVLALYDADMIDKLALTRSHYLKLLARPPEFSSRVAEFDLVADVREAWTREQARQRRLAPPASSGMDKIGRNDPCPCGSGRKYKQCCGKR